MGCFGAVVGLRQALAITRAYPEALVAVISVELCSLHFAPDMDLDGMTGFALFGDAGAAVLVSSHETARGPEIADAYCSADFSTSDQMSWTITDQGFLMGLSPRVPVTLRRQVAPATRTLLESNGLAMSDIAHWLIHPGGPSVLEAIQGRLELTEEQMAPSWAVLRDHGNCSSPTVLLILDELLRSGRTSSGEWGVMMAFGPGLTLEMCLLRF
jgi:predicted naringenin-chalcone synthase